ncbi:heme-binding protein 2 [Ricinus communis]|uniref:Heme-binding protein, putative n=1 Tax=Ricinus communis TaxID=3988 RepID=B9SPI4_RICCO|nr:heme-binding protein 2 [Ricinus communis]EEF34460.1 Heme-binding protein, putative [Ricinus communis]|eukprot:XP_002527903.1 heme-binding protein 2 [Ricinus communis]
MEVPLLILVAATICFGASNLVFYGHAIGSPNYTLLHSESDYELRLYREVSWISALVQGSSFQKSTKDGFHRIYQYIHGENLNSAQLPMTAPVLTSIVPSSTATVHYVRLFLNKSNPPQPNPELNLQFTKWRAQCIAVRNFSGFAEDDNVKKEMEGLVASLTKHSTGNTAVINDTSSYTIAQYNSSHYQSRRYNEVWIDVSGVNIDGCLPH